MKLSDIDDMNKIAGEYRKAKLFLDTATKNNMVNLELKYFTSHSESAHTALKIGQYSAYNQEFRIAFLENIKGYVDLLQTKLALYGVDEFK
jgi:hypothetical protein